MKEIAKLKRTGENDKDIVFKLVRNALVWASQGIYSKYEYLERIFFDAILGEDNETDTLAQTKSSKYDTIGEYKVKDYKERPHEYTDK